MLAPQHALLALTLLSLQLLTIVATAIAFVGAVGSLFGMNVYFCVNPSPLVSAARFQLSSLWDACC